MLKILETHPSLTVDTAAVSAAWPDDRDKPSARAITERLVRIRKNAGVHFAVRSANSKSSTAGGTNGARNAPSAPRKTKPKANGEEAVEGGNANGSAGSNKRKRASKVKKEHSDPDEDEEAAQTKISEKEVVGETREAAGTVAYDDQMGNGVDHEDEGDEAEYYEEQLVEEDSESPAKRHLVEMEGPVEEYWHGGGGAEDEIDYYEEV